MDSIYVYTIRILIMYILVRILSTRHLFIIYHLRIHVSSVTYHSPIRIYRHVFIDILSVYIIYYLSISSIIYIMNV